MLMTGQCRRQRLHSPQQRRPQLTAGRTLHQSRSQTAAPARRRRQHRPARVLAGDTVGCGGGWCCCGASPGSRLTWSPSACGACWCVPALVWLLTWRQTCNIRHLYHRALAPGMKQQLSRRCGRGRRHSWRAGRGNRASCWRTPASPRWPATCTTSSCRIWQRRSHATSHSLVRTSVLP